MFRSYFHQGVHNLDDVVWSIFVITWSGALGHPGIDYFLLEIARNGIVADHTTN